MKITAILVVRNEHLYIEKTIKYLIDEGIDIAIIDNESSDGTLEICNKYYPNHVKIIKNLPYSGDFNLQEHIAAGKALANEIETDWLISQAADERLCSDIEGESLSEAIHRIDKAGFDSINFEEFVFIYENREIRYENTDFHHLMKRYYFYEPRKNRLIRACKKGVDLSDPLVGCHTLDGATKLYNNLIMRHYIALSYEYAVNKYTKRQFNASDLSLGWHGNRTNITIENLDHKNINLLKADSYTGKLDKSKPYTKHFWEMFATET
jgi:glycosyltransferase involved in cell wall biosynthesis